jgi:hypothetical protein
MAPVHAWPRWSPIPTTPATMSQHEPRRMRSLGSALNAAMMTATDASTANTGTGDGGLAAAVVHAAQETAGAFSTLERQLRHTDSFNDVREVDAGEWCRRCCCCRPADRGARGRARTAKGGGAGHVLSRHQLLCQTGRPVVERQACRRPSRHEHNRSRRAAAAC